MMTMRWAAMMPVCKNKYRVLILVGDGYRFFGEAFKGEETAYLKTESCRGKLYGSIEELLSSVERSAEHAFAERLARAKNIRKAAA